MMRKIAKNFIQVLFWVLLSIPSFSQNIPDRPAQQKLVNDLAGMLSDQEVNALERKLVAFNDSTSTQITVVTVNSFDGYEKSDYAQRLGEKWGIGQKGLNNGVLILVKPKTPGSNGEVFIAPGYGLEGVIPDIVAGQIVDFEVLPAFRANNYYEGLDRATSTIMSLARGEFSASQYSNSVKKKAGTGASGGLVFIIIVVIFISVISRRGGGSNRRNISSSGNLPLWLLLGMMGSGGRSHSGSWGGFSGGGGFGGGGGGGFGGFGGGSFGGGGAGGSW